ncbi:zinc carboxypeptidase [Nonlabens sp. YIK11]|uniref:M14 family metallopeptidase n=1 Tax=Nonlabens sp. YIK11 TaxID=1453349 RepID=UPI0006DC8AE2|nr:M14 family metallopeptidase [Nonlabens sp. YIK11]KQC34549.1 zinc carboxypeptidase [Nonlabens sp. YIK11]
MRKSLFLSLLFLASIAVQAQLQSPADFLGYEIGTQFSRHADVVRYFEHVAENSDMVTYQEYGKTNERRPLTYAIVTSPANQNNIEQIRKNNLAQTGIIEGNATSDKAIVWLSYNVHGNEASSTEASMVTLYELITTKKDWLENTVVIIDPCVNPDGRDRYANWYNQVASQPYDPLQIAAEHNEPWPGGRPNHYLFDLNRDWAWATQVESQQRLKVYNQWMPQIHVDFHEQGINEPYYFAPAAEPFHEVITDFQREFQTKIGQNHAQYFDNEGWLYFTRERFDLLYPSYGDTYPTYMGAIGMTYEQAGHGRAGLGINNDEGFELTLVDRVVHHKTTGLSTIEVASQNVEKLNTEFEKYFDNSNLTTKSFVLKGSTDQLMALAKLLDRHEIQYGFTGKGKTNGLGYNNDKKTTLEYDTAMVVSTNQPKGKMVQVLFEPNAQLSTPLTYDITAWNLPKAYGLEAVASTSNVSGTSATLDIKTDDNTNNTATGYIAKWNSMQDARFLAKLLKAGIKVRFTEKPFVNNGTTYDRGSLIITKSDNKRIDNFGSIVNSVANEFKRGLEPALSSFATSGPDFGSPDVKLISAPRVALLRGERTSSLSYGATWYFFEQDLGYPVTSIDTGDLGRADLSQFDVLVMPDGYYGSLLNESTLNKVKTFVRSGGKVVALSGAVSAFADKDGFGIAKNDKDQDSTEDKDEKKDLLIPYAAREESGTTDLITGSIFKITMDQTHPMAFGYGDAYYSLKLGSDSYSYLDDGYNVGWITDDVVNVSGFAGDTAKTKLKSSMVFGEQRLGAGSLIYMVDDPLFRAFWENGKLLFVNSVFLVNNNRPEL